MRISSSDHTIKDMSYLSLGRRKPYTYLGIVAIISRAEILLHNIIVASDVVCQVGVVCARKDGQFPVGSNLPYSRSLVGVRHR